MFDLFNQTDDDDAEVSESVNMDRFMLEKKLEDYFFDDLEIYFKTRFFEKVCHREAWAIESGFAALPQELRRVAFHHAVLTNHAKTLKAFLRAARNIKADINTDFDTFPERISPLMMACYYGCRRSFLTLVEDGKADLSVCDDQGHSLAYACTFTNLDFMKWAQRYGVVFDVNDPVDALIPLAAEYGSFSVLRWLIEDLGGDVNITDKCDYSALNYALYKDKDIFLYLVDKGAKMTGKYEVLFGFIIDQIRELQKQPPSEMIDRRIDHQIETLRFLMNKA